MKPYFRTLILFPLILQGLATALFWFLGWDLEPVPFYRYLTVAFFLATIPAFLIAFVATTFRYVRHNIVSIVLCSSLISFFYCNIASYFYLFMMNETEASIWEWVIQDGLVLGLLGMCGMVFYSLFVLPFLLPKTKS
ncbi:hypothetical protein [Rodentibacter heidelbergensis]|uniref:Uncharacterized protein n=1 Tax=Rodentibacter heidelbergensis TaxID=1908258 RepID=A0A1V3I9J4_9PAST|nr:hypothetical protein [Rodentibacter heidelbergensis]OOF36777.1 hypothetical protein BKK48_04225 [Rodentibacter heidelbergensis]